MNRRKRFVDFLACLVFAPIAIIWVLGTERQKRKQLRELRRLEFVLDIHGDRCDLCGLGIICPTQRELLGRIRSLRLEN